LDHAAVVLVATDVLGADDVSDLDAGHWDACNRGPDVFAEGAAGPEALANRDIRDLRSNDTPDVEVVVAGVAQGSRDPQLGRAPFRHPAGLVDTSRVEK